jgi:hypothetical protein
MLAVYAGALYDLYFDDVGDLRQLPLDGDVEAVLAASAMPRVALAVDRVIGLIGEQRERFLGLPLAGQAHPGIDITVVTDGKLRGRDELQQLRHGETELIEDLEAGSDDSLSRWVSAENKAFLGDVLNGLARRYGVARRWLTTENPLTTKLAWLETKGLRRL